MSARLVWINDFQPTCSLNQGRKKGYGHSTFQFVKEPGFSRASKGLVNNFTIRSQAAKSRESSRRHFTKTNGKTRAANSCRPQTIEKAIFLDANYEEIQFSDPLDLVVFFRDALMHATDLLSVAEDANNEHKQQSRLHLLRYRGNVLRMIQRQLGTLSDLHFASAVVKIACLAIFESLNGDLVTSQIHIDGLEKVVRVGIGTESYLLSRELRKLVTWATLCYSVLSQQIPKSFLLRIDGDEICQGFDLPDAEVVSPLQAYEINLQKTTHNYHVSREAVIIFCYLRRLSKIWNEIAEPTSHTKSTAGEAFDFLEHVESRTARLLISAHTCSENHPRWTIVSFCLAANIYIYAVLREIPLSVPYFAGLVTRLRDATQKMDIAALEESLVKKMLWVFFMGRLVAQARPEQEWFEQKLRDAAGSCGLDCVDTIKLVFRQMLWPRRGRGRAGWPSTVRSMGIMAEL